MNPDELQLNDQPTQEDMSPDQAAASLAFATTLMDHLTPDQGMEDESQRMESREPAKEEARPEPKEKPEDKNPTEDLTRQLDEFKGEMKGMIDSELGGIRDMVEKVLEEESTNGE